MNVTLPEWLYEKELDPGAGAYENLKPSLRAHLKEQIALLHEIWLPEKADGGSFCYLPCGGTYVTKQRAAGWALFVLSGNYASPAGFIAAVLPALMAGAEVVICRLGGAAAPLAPAISAAMELLGCEEIFSLSADDCKRLVRELAAQRQGVCAVALGHDFDGAHVLPATVSFGLADTEPDLNVLRWLHPGATVEPLQDDKTYDAAIATDLSCARAAQSAPLTLGSGYEYFWQWPQIGPSFFRKKVVVLGGGEK